MTDDTTPDTVRFILLRAECLTSLLENDLRGASEVAGIAIPSEFLDGKWLWELRLEQMRNDPASAQWLARATVRKSDGSVVGWAGFHGPPDDSGMVEIGYQVLPRFRGQGLGLATASALIQEAWGDQLVRRIRASISPDNAPSLAIVHRLGFTQIGEEIDEVDGLEIVFELAAPSRG